MIIKKLLIDHAKKLVSEAHAQLMLEFAGSDDAPVVEAYEEGLDGAAPNPDSQEMLVEAFRALIEKQQATVVSDLEGLLHQTNREQNLREKNVGVATAQLLQDVTLSKLKQQLKAWGADALRDWERIAATELSNAVNLGSVERILADNEGKTSSEVYVYRINPDDAGTCKYCRAFYIDEDGSPKLYRLSTLLANGTNYGKTTAAWQPVAGATHPNCRDSGLLELRSGYQLLPGGSVKYVGHPTWQAYLAEKLEA